MYKLRSGEGRVKYAAFKNLEYMNEWRRKDIVMERAIRSMNDNCGQEDIAINQVDKTYEMVEQLINQRRTAEHQWISFQKDEMGNIVFAERG